MAKRTRPLVDWSQVCSFDDDERATLALLTPGDWVVPKREPTNAADKNAVYLTDQQGRPLGYLSRGVAKSLAPLMDSGWWTYGLMSQVEIGPDGRGDDGSAIVFCYDPKDDKQVRKAMTEIAEQVRKDMAKVHYIAFPVQGSGAYGLPVRISGYAEPAYKRG